MRGCTIAAKHFCEYYSVKLLGLSGALGSKTNLSPWLTPEVSHEKMNVFNLLGSDNKLSVNSFDVVNNSLVCGGDRQTLFYLENFDE